MLKKRIKWKWTILGGLALGCLLGVNTTPKTVYAATLQPTATLTINNGGTTNFSTTLDTNNGTKSALIAVPVKVEVEQTDKYSMGIYLDCTDAPSECNTGNLGALTDNNLTPTNGTTTKISSITSKEQFGSISNNHWGFWYLNNTTTPTVEGSTGTYVSPVPTTTTGTNTIPETAISNAIPETSAGSNGTTTVNGQLVFGTKADSTLASGSYSGKVVVTLTATPQEVAEGTFAGINNMQEMTPAICAAVDKDDPVASQGTLIDTRDGKSYLVGKLADGRCWMLQNLAINIGITLKPTDSNVSSDYTIPSFAGFPSEWWSSDYGAYVKNGNHQDNEQDTAVIADNRLTANTGNYYSFLAATAGTGTGSSGDAPSSICPKGWRLPTGGSDGQFQTLHNKYGNVSDFTTAFKVAATGYCDSDICPHVSSNAYYWSSTLQSGTNGYYIIANSGGVGSAYNNNKRSGHSIRCIVDIPPSPLKTGDTMQGANGASCAAMNIGDIINMVDSRDSKSYIVGRLADGNCWMLQNLAIDTGAVLKPADSDVSRDYTIPNATGWSSNAVAYAKNGTHQDNQRDTDVPISDILTANTGNYYSFLAATAGTGADSYTGNAPSSICPKGWKLPTGSDGGQFQTLYNKYGDAGDFYTAFKCAATGACGSAHCPSDGNSAHYWSSTRQAFGDYAHTLGAHTSLVSSVQADVMMEGLSVRCILVAD